VGKRCAKSVAASCLRLPFSWPAAAKTENGQSNSSRKRSWAPIRPHAPLLTSIPQTNKEAHHEPQNDQMDHPGTRHLPAACPPGAAEPWMLPSATVFPGDRAADSPWTPPFPTTVSTSNMCAAALKGIGDTAQAPAGRPRPACAHARPGHWQIVATGRLACERPEWQASPLYPQHLRLAAQQ